MHSRIATFCFFLAISFSFWGCTGGDETAHMGTPKNHHNANGLGQFLKRRTDFMPIHSGDALRDEMTTTIDSFDEAGRHVWRRKWQGSRPWEHTEFHYDSVGRRTAIDHRVMMGRVGTYVQILHDGPTEERITFHPDGTVTVKEKAHYGENGQLIRQTIWVYPHIALSGKREVEVTEMGPCGQTGDTIHWCRWEGGALKYQEWRYKGNVVRSNDYNPSGKMKSYTVGTFEEGKSVTSYFDRKGKLTSRLMMDESQHGDTALVETMTEYTEEGWLASLNETFYDRYGEEIGGRRWVGNPENELTLTDEFAYTYRRDAIGNVVMKLGYENGKLQTVTAMEYVYP